MCAPSLNILHIKNHHISLPRGTALCKSEDIPKKRWMPLNVCTERYVRWYLLLLLASYNRTTEKSDNPPHIWRSVLKRRMQTRQALAKIYCSEEITHGLEKQIICLSVINTVLAITAIVGNTVILIALHKETSLHRPSTESIELRIA